MKCKNSIFYFFGDLVCFSLSAENTLLEAICEILMVHPTTALVFFSIRHEEDTAKSEQWAVFLLGGVSREAAPLESRMKRNNQKLGQSQTWMSGTQDYWDKLSLMMLCSHFTGFKTPLVQYKKNERWIYFSKCFRKIKQSSASSFLLYCFLSSSN